MSYVHKLPALDPKMKEALKTHIIRKRQRLKRQSEQEEIGLRLKQERQLLLQKDTVMIQLIEDNIIKLESKLESLKSQHKDLSNLYEQGKTIDDDEDENDNEGDKFKSTDEQEVATKPTNIGNNNLTDRPVQQLKSKPQIQSELVDVQSTNTARISPISRAGSVSGDAPDSDKNETNNIHNYSMNNAENNGNNITRAHQKTPSVPNIVDSDQPIRTNPQFSIPPQVTIDKKASSSDHQITNSSHQSNSHKKQHIGSNKSLPSPSPRSIPSSKETTQSTHLHMPQSSNSMVSLNNGLNVVYPHSYLNPYLNGPSHLPPTSAVGLHLMQSAHQSDARSNHNPINMRHPPGHPLGGTYPPDLVRSEAQSFDSSTKSPLRNSTGTSSNLESLAKNGNLSLHDLGGNQQQHNNNINNKNNNIPLNGSIKRSLSVSSAAESAYLDDLAASHSARKRLALHPQPPPPPSISSSGHNAFTGNNLQSQPLPLSLSTQPPPFPNGLPPPPSHQASHHPNPSLLPPPPPPPHQGYNHLLSSLPPGLSAFPPSYAHLSTAPTSMAGLPVSSAGGPLNMFPSFNINPRKQHPLCNPSGPYDFMLSQNHVKPPSGGLNMIPNINLFYPPPPPTSTTSNNLMLGGNPYGNEADHSMPHGSHYSPYQPPVLFNPPTTKQQLNTNNKLKGQQQIDQYQQKGFGFFPPGNGAPKK